MHIGAGYIHFQNPNLLLFVQQLAGIGIVLHGEAAHVGDHRLVKDFFQLRQFMLGHMVHPGILQTNGIDHAGGAFCNAGGGIAKTSIPCGALKGERA